VGAIATGFGLGGLEEAVEALQNAAGVSAISLPSACCPFNQAIIPPDPLDMSKSPNHAPASA